MASSPRVTSAVKDWVLRYPARRPFQTSSLHSLGPRKAVLSALYRLVVRGEIERVSRGVYVRLETIPPFGRIGAELADVVELIMKSKDAKYQIHGVEAVRKFGLTTQMQVTPVFYTTARSMQTRVYNLTVRFQHAPSYCFQHTDSVAGLAIVALYFLGPEGLTLGNVSKILNKLRTADLEKLQSSEMPPWMRQVISLPLADLVG